MSRSGVHRSRVLEVGRLEQYAEKQLADAEEIHDKLQWQLKRAKKMIREAKTELRSVIAREDG